MSNIYTDFNQMILERQILCDLLKIAILENISIGDIMQCCMKIIQIDIYIEGISDKIALTKF